MMGRQSETQQKLFYTCLNLEKRIRPERLDWLWFLGYDLDDKIPGHRVLSKARAR